MNPVELPDMRVRVEIEPAPITLRTRRRRWDWRLCMRTEDGRHVNTMQAGSASTEPKAARKALGALADLIGRDVDGIVRQRRRVIAVQPMEPIP